MHNGTDCSFYQDNTFKICIWWYGVSRGWIKSFIRGNYQYCADTKTIELFVDESSKQGITHSSSGKPYPAIYYMIEEE